MDLPPSRSPAGGCVYRGRLGVGLRRTARLRRSMVALIVGLHGSRGISCDGISALYGTIKNEVSPDGVGAVI